MVKTPIFFTHIPKTAGTSFKDSVVSPNLPEEAILKYRNRRQWGIDLAKYQLVSGHFKYGLHWFFRMPPRYITFFRDPVDRAVSYYYFIKDCDRKLYLHPLRDFADSRDLTGFYCNRRLQNIQTHFIAGYFASEMHLRLPWLYTGRRLLAKAKSNLDRHYLAFGLQERFEESLAIFQECLGWKNRVRVEPRKKTNARPRLHDVLTDDRVALERANSLDIELYRHAARCFPG